MKAQDILTRVNAILALNPDPVVKSELDKLASDLAAQVRMECAAKTGGLNATRTITAMLAYEKKHGCRPALQYQWQDKADRQCVCDGFRAFRLTEHLPLEERPKDAGDGVDLDKVFPANLAGYEALPLPSAGELKAHIALERANFTGKAKDFTPLWQFGEGKPTVNAAYLRDMIAVLPNAAEIFWNPKSIFGPLYAKDDHGDSVLLPVRTTAAMEAYKAQEAAEKCAAAIREDARKDYTAQCEDYKRRIERDPETALTPDEFERLTRWANWQNAA